MKRVSQNKRIEGDPTPRSPFAVERDRNYQMMHDYMPRQYYPTACEMIVKHKPTGTYWKAVYRVREDDSDAECGATWRQVAPERVVRTEYLDVPSERRSG